MAIMENKPLLSIIVPVYNVEKYLSRCLESLLGQSLRELEIICVDDGSTDGSSEILNHYSSDKRIKTVRQTNAGVSAARNHGLTLVSAPYITFVDADDWMEDFYSQAISVLQSDTELDFINWGFQIVEEDKNGNLQKVEEGGLADRFERYSGKCLLTGEVKRHTSGNCCNKIFKHKLIAEYALSFPVGLGIAEDAAFWWKYSLSAHYGFYLNSRPYNYFSRGEGSATGLMQQKTLPDPYIYLEVFKDIYDYYAWLGRNRSIEDQSILGGIFMDLCRDGVRYSANPEDFLAKAAEVARQYDFPNESDSKMRDLKSGGKVWKIGKNQLRPKYTILEKLFSVKNWREYKVVHILGLRFMISRRKND